MTGAIALTLSSLRAFASPGRPLMPRAALPVGGRLVVTSNLGPRAACLRSKGLNCSRMPSSTTPLCSRFSLRARSSWATLRFCFLDVCGPTIPCSLKVALRRFSWEPAIVAGVAVGWFALHRVLSWDFFFRKILIVIVIVIGETTRRIYARTS